MNTHHNVTGRHSHAPAGFTLTELLVVILIIGIVSAATLPAVIPAISHRQVSEGARVLQATIKGASDAAIRANAPRGIRLMPDPQFPGPALLAANRMIAIEPAPDYNSGRISVFGPGLASPYPPGNLPTTLNNSQISVTEAVFDNSGLVNEPTSWYWNIRQGDKIRFGDSGRYYTIAGPFQKGAYDANNNNIAYNVERYVNYGPPRAGRPVAIGTPAPTASDPNPLAGAAHLAEVLYLVNGQDDDGDGWVDEGFDGIDNDGDGVTDPGYNGLDDDGNGVVDNVEELSFNGGGEFEPEQFIGNQFATSFTNQPYTILRRPIVSEGAREVALPDGVVIDLTTWNAATTVTSQTNPAIPAGGAQLPERSRLPVDPFTYSVDVMISPNGQVQTTGGGTSSLNAGSAAASPTSSLPFYHFWVAERDDVVEPIWGVANFTPPTVRTPLIGVPVSNPNFPATRYLLPMPQGTANYTTPNGNNTSYLKGDRRLVTLFVRTGQVLTNTIEKFDGGDTSVPYYSAQFGTRDGQ